MDFGVGPTRVDINIKIAPVERTMAGEEAAAAAQAPDEPGFLYNVHCHMSNKTAYAEPVPIAAEAVQPATVVDSEKKDGDDGDGGGASYSGLKDSEDAVEVVSENTDKGAVKIAGGFHFAANSRVHRLLTFDTRGRFFR